jgi:hypothetical protein
LWNKLIAPPVEAGNLVDWLPETRRRLARKVLLTQARRIAGETQYYQRLKDGGFWYVKDTLGGSRVKARDWVRDEAFFDSLELIGHGGHPRSKGIVPTISETPIQSRLVTNAAIAGGVFFAQ